MKGQRFTPEKIIGLLRQAEVELAEGKRVSEVCSGLGISEQSYYRWRSEYGGLKLEQARRMKDLEKENIDQLRNASPLGGNAPCASGVKIRSHCPRPFCATWTMALKGASRPGPSDGWAK